jgi:hypothetical protein|nr:MAG TPA: hypothetical protein [Caudoviricetes sp.]
MKKAKIGRRILDVIDESEFIRRSSLNPDIVASLAEDTAIEKDGHVYPVTKQYSKDVTGVTDLGKVLLYSLTEQDKSADEYKVENVIDFENVKSLQESISKQNQLMSAERTILVSPENIFTPVIKEEDTPEMKLLKQAICLKGIDLDNYKQRFGSDYNNDRRLFEQNSITFFKLKRLAEIMDMNVSLSLEDKPGAPNPIGEKLTIQITSDGER